MEDLLSHLEVLALGNLDPRIHFAILGDFTDAEARDLPGDAAILAAARGGIEALNARLGEERGDRFFLLHRARQWNPGEGVWMGWERKRGKLEELNRLLRGATDTSFEVQVGATAIFPSVRYCITLDTDTRLPRDAARKLVGIIAHPLNRPRFDPACGRVTEGYGILQPRVSVASSSAAGSRFARIFAGQTTVDPYTTAVSDTYQDLFGEGTFTGKGLYDVDAFAAALTGRVPDNALLSHDLFEGLHARAALVTDVEVVDDYPSNVLTHSRRQHRWARGDWQILAWLLPFVPTRAGLKRNQLPMLSRWKILDNLRRSLLAPATLLLLLAAWTFLPGSPAIWTGFVVAAAAFPLFPLALEAAAGPRAQQPWRAFLRGVREDAGSGVARVVLQLAFLANQAYEMVHAVVVTLVRLVFTRRGLLEWETSAASAARGTGTRGGAGARPFLVEMAASPAIAAAGLLLVSAFRPGALLVAAPILALWAAAPFIANVLSRTPVRRELSAPDRAFLLAVARKTWGYFATFMGPEDHGLPPDNFQEVPVPRVAHRTSPTNIGMGLLSVLAAHDLGILEEAELLERVDATLTTVEGLERLEGHLYNWYDTVSLAPLDPRYVSTVDSGNLAGALIALAEGLRELGPSAVAAGLAARASALADGMDFRFLYDPRRRLLSIGYRAADADGPGALDASHYDLLASEARLASFVAIAKGDLPELHWFRLGRIVTGVHGVPTLLSWSGTMFEYLMPLLLMRSYPGTLLEESCRSAVRRQRDYAAERGVAWGISESAYDLVDRHDNYQYKAFGVPGLGLKRGLGDELVVAPYASALATMVDPEAAVRNLQPARGRGARGSARLLRGRRLHPASRRRTRGAAPGEARPRGRRGAHLLRAPPGHDARGARQRPAGEPHGRPVPRRRARPRHRAAAAGEVATARPVRAATAGRGQDPGPRGSGAGRAPLPLGPHPLPTRPVPVERQLHRGGDQRRRRRQLLPGPVRHPVTARRHLRPGQPVPLPPGRAQRTGLVGHPAPHAGRGRGLPRHLRRRACHLPPSRGRDRDPARRRRLARGRRRGPAPGGDEPQRPAPRDRGDELRRDGPGPAGGRPGAPGVRQALRRVGVRLPRARRSSATGGPAPPTTCRPGGCTSSARRGGRRGRWSGRPTGPASWGEGATRPTRRRSTGGRSPEPPGSCSIPSSACASGSGSRPGARPACPSPPGCPPAGRRRWRWRSATGTRARRPGPSRSPRRTRGARSVTWGSPPTRRSSSSGSPRGSSGATRRSALRPSSWPGTPSGRPDSGPRESPATSPSCSSGS